MFRTTWSSGIYSRCGKYLPGSNPFMCISDPLSIIKDFCYGVLRVLLGFSLNIHGYVAGKTILWYIFKKAPADPILQATVRGDSLKFSSRRSNSPHRWHTRPTYDAMGSIVNIWKPRRLRCCELQHSNEIVRIPTKAGIPLVAPWSCVCGQCYCEKEWIRGTRV